jgi:predicted dehydrogenase
MIGCGAVADLYYAPALKQLVAEGLVEVAGAFDPDPAAAARFGAKFPSAAVTGSLTTLLGFPLDLAVVASPPRFHAEQTMAALEAGIAVHCEKPLATSHDQGRRMADAAAKAGLPLSVGMMRRHFPATRAIRRLIGAGAIGTLQTIECFEGGPFRWPVRSPAYFLAGDGNGGVLQDIGIHCLDLLCWWLGPPLECRYEDDAMGGVEANCRIALRFGTCSATVRLSRDWARPNCHVIRGSRGWIRWPVEEVARFEWGAAESPLVGHVAMEEGTGARATFHDAFVAQLRAAIAGESFVPAESALPALDLVDLCYRTRQPMAMPWLKERG